MKPRCNGICLTGSDIGVPSAEIAYPHPECEAHGGGLREEADGTLLLWAHLVSEHACIIRPEVTLAELEDLHHHEHAGPCTIRNHPRESLAYSLKKIASTLSELAD